MRYDISLTISYKYQQPAAGARQIIHLMPADRPGRQRLIAGSIDLDPVPARRDDRFDFFGNAETTISFEDAFSHIDIRLHARVEVTGNAAPQGQAATLAAMPAEVSKIRDLGPNSPAHFLGTTPRTPENREISAYAAEMAQGQDDVAAIVEALGLALNRDMKFDPEATTVDTPAADAFAKRHGVCQDFTHIMISGLRSLGIPAAYVSGFLRTIPPPGQPRLEGADAMHAWVMAWCGGTTGWVEYDPTNATFAGTDHVVVGFGRDYGDVSPVRGVMRTYGAQESKQAVDMVPL